MMKSSVIISLLAIFAVACHPVNVPDDSTAVLPESFVAKIGDVADVHGPWTEGETFTVFGSQESAVYAYDKSAKRFRCVDVGKRLTVSGSYHAVYPAAFGEQVSPGEFHVTIPARQEWQQKYVSPQANIMVAVSDNVAAEELTFHSAVGYLKVIAKSTERIRSVTLSGNGGEIIAGAASLKAENESIPLLSMTGSGKTVVIDCGSEGVEPLPDGNEFIFCLPGVTFSKGVTVVVDSEKGSKTYSDDNELKVTRGRMAEVNFCGTGTSFTSFGLLTSDGRQYMADDLYGPEITVCVPYGTDIRSLTPVFGHTGESVTVGKTSVMSGKTTFNFSSKVKFTVTSIDGKSVSYNVAALDYNIPVVHLSTPDHAKVLDKETWIAESTFQIRDVDGTVVDYGSASIKGRGNASWKRDKKSYSVKLAVKPKELGVLGLPGHKRWCLIAVQWGYLGNNVGYELSRRTASFAWQPHGRYVEFVMNGEHRGTYMLVEQIKIDKNRVNIKSLKPEDIGDDKISGGYLLTYDRTYNDPIKFKSAYYQMPVMVKDPDDDEIVSEQFDWIRNYINEMEASMHDDARFAKNEYMDYLDIDTYIDMWFVWEIAGATGSHGEADFAHPNSVWFHKDRNGKLKAGPCWDFDSYLFSTQKLLCNEGQYYGRLFTSPAFKARVKEKWPEFRASVEGRGKFATPITEFIDSCRNVVSYSAERNQKMWTWTFYKLEEEHKTIREGLPAKMDWLEKQIEAL